METEAISIPVDGAESVSGLWQAPAEARACLVLALSHAGRHEEAAAEIAVALRLDPESLEVNYRAGTISYSQGGLAPAAVRHERAPRAPP